MNSKEIYKLSKELTEKKVNSLLIDLKEKKEVEKIRLFNSLVSLGDSVELAMATAVLSEKKEYNIELFNQAYYS